MTVDLAGKYFVVTGGTAGVGEATAALLAERGAAGIAICGRNVERGEAVRSALAARGCRSVFIKADLAKIDDCFAVIDGAIDAFGRLDALINCCGSTERGALESTSPELWDYLFAVNVRAPFFLIQRAVPHMRRTGRGGAIANIGSIAAHGGQPYISAYCASKAALVVLTKNLANALRWDRIRVNILNIGWTNTPTEHAIQTGYHKLGEGWLERVSKNQPFGRLLEPVDVAKGLLFLVSDESSLMTGAAIDFDQTVIGAFDDNPIGNG